MRILKFGGTSVATPERVRGVVEIVRDSVRQGPVAVVVSAFGGVTDALLDLARRAEARDDGYRERIAELEARHREAVAELASEADRPALAERVHAIHRELAQLVDGVFMVGEASARTLDRVLGVGETVSAACVAAALRRAGTPADDADARRLIVTDRTFGNARVLEEDTHARIREHFAAASTLQVVTGFVAATGDGETTTLGRGGSDYTASILGAALAAEAVEIWTDVDGVLSADPRIVHDAVKTERLRYDELMELSHFGAKVIYPPSVHPTRTRSIPLRIRNTFAPADAGTLVTAEDAPGYTVRGIASIPLVDLLRLEGDGMLGVPGIAGRLFGALARHGVSVILITQASSEHSICFAVAPEATERAALGVEEEFGAERRAGLIDELVIERDLAVVAVVGAGMREKTGVAGRLFGGLGSHGINVRAVAQGSSELNISLVVAAADERRTIRAIHDTFFVSGERTVDLFLAGVGRVGRSLLAQIEAQAPALLERERVRLRLAGVAVSGGALLDETGLAPAEAEARVRSSADPVDLDAMTAAAGRDRGRDRVWIDCTAGTEVPARYDALLASGAAVVTANKLRLAASLEDWRRLTADRKARRLYHETTVGAAL
ncbi:MAG TPA: aspartate kinase, partial [bacterium]|nr:aspartate kinase [bacterium]